jgi:hypothetical protein
MAKPLCKKRPANTGRFFVVGKIMKMRILSQKCPEPILTIYPPAVKIAEILTKEAERMDEKCWKRISVPV